MIAQRREDVAVCRVVVDGEGNFEVDDLPKEEEKREGRGEWERKGRRARER